MYLPVGPLFAVSQAELTGFVEFKFPGIVGCPRKGPVDPLMPCDAIFVILHDFQGRTHVWSREHASGRERKRMTLAHTHTNTQTYTSLSGVVFRDFSAFSLAAAVPVAAFGMGEV